MCDTRTVETRELRNVAWMRLALRMIAIIVVIDAVCMLAVGCSPINGGLYLPDDCMGDHAVDFVACGQGIIVPVDHYSIQYPVSSQDNCFTSASF